MQVSYESLIEEIGGIAQNYGFDLNSTNEEESEGEFSPDLYIKEFLESVRDIIGSQLVQQIHGDDAETGNYSFDANTLISPESFFLISSELDEMKVIDNMIFAFRLPLNEDEESIFDEVLTLYQEGDEENILEYISEKKSLDSLNSKSILYKLLHGITLGNGFIETIHTLLREAGHTISFLSEGDEDLPSDISSFINEVRNLLLSKVGNPNISTLIH